MKIDYNHQPIQVIDAFYGRKTSASSLGFDTSKCEYSSFPNQECKADSSTVLAKIQAECNGNTCCLVNADYGVLDVPDPCPGLNGI